MAGDCIAMGFFASHVRQDGGLGARQQSLARAGWADHQHVVDNRQSHFPAGQARVFRCMVKIDPFKSSSYFSVQRLILQ